MQIDNTKNHQTFGAKFTNTETLHKVVDYAISKNKFNKNLNCKFVSEEKISSNTYDSLWRLTVVDCESNELYCIKYVRFRRYPYTFKR